MRSTRSAIAAAILALIAFAPAQPAGAHGGGAEFRVLEASSRDGRVVAIRVAITYSSDGEPAEAALVDAVGHGPGGRTTARLELTRHPGGVYQLRTTVRALGAWRFDISSRFPPGSKVIEVKVTDHPARSAWWIAIAAGLAFVAVAVVVGWFRTRHH